MKITKINKKLIKPHTPTPQNLKNYKFSFIDQFGGPMNFGVILLYESKSVKNTHLEESLSKTLVKFYPLAGRYIKNDHMVDCSDQGVEFTQAEAQEIELIDLITNIKIDQLDSLFPDQYFRSDDQLMSIQATHFPCGGIAIAISVSHSIFDVSSLGTFISSWSKANNITPTFELPSILPYKHRDLGFSVDQLILDTSKIVVKRLVFDRVALTNLRSKLSRTTIPRVRVVCAIIAKAMIRLDDRGFVISQAMNMRGRTIPPLHKHACGNFAIFALTRHVPKSKDIGLQELVDLLDEAVERGLSDHVEILSPHRDGRDLIIDNYDNFKNVLSDSDTNLMVFTDWSKFGFYEADFGWGEPVWAGIGPQRPIVRSVVLMSDKEGDGIEAWVHLNEDEMCCFEQDEDIKLFIT